MPKKRADSKATEHKYIDVRVVMQLGAAEGASWWQVTAEEGQYKGESVRAEKFDNAALAWEHYTHKKNHSYHYDECPVCVAHPEEHERKNLVRS